MRRPARRSEDGGSAGPGLKAKPKDEDRARELALRRLVRRDHSEHEVRAALRRHGFTARVIDSAVRRLRGERYLDDAAFAARFARSRMSHHGLGRRRVGEALRQRGVSRRIIEAGLTEALEEVSETATLEALARKYWRQQAREAPARRLGKLWVFLLRRGFPPALVFDRLGALWPRWRKALADLEAPGGDVDEDPNGQ